jgi:hypothetical protein
MVVLYIVLIIGIGLSGFFLRRYVSNQVAKNNEKSSSIQKYLLFTAWFCMVLTLMAIVAIAMSLVDIDYPGLIMRQVGFLAGLPFVVWIVWGIMILVRIIYKLLMSFLK